MSGDFGRVGAAETGPRPTGQAPAGLDASRFDPARIATAIKSMTKTQPKALMALPRAGLWATASEMKHLTTAASLDILYIMRSGYNSFAFCQRRWTKWGGERGQKRGEGYEYTITPFGEAVRQTIRDSDAGSAEDPKGLHSEGVAARAVGIARNTPPNPPPTRD